jgi:hypothetical protein
MKKALRAVIERYELPVTLTPHQNIVLREVEPAWKEDIQRTLEAAGIMVRAAQARRRSAAPRTPALLVLHCAPAQQALQAPAGVLALARPAAYHPHLPPSLPLPPLQPAPPFAHRGLLDPASHTPPAASCCPCRTWPTWTASTACPWPALPCRCAAWPSARRSAACQT